MVFSVYTHTKVEKERERPIGTGPPTPFTSPTSVMLRKDQPGRLAVTPVVVRERSGTQRFPGTPVHPARWRPATTVPSHQASDDNHHELGNGRRDPLLQSPPPPRLLPAVAPLSVRPADVHKSEQSTRPAIPSSGSHTLLLPNHPVAGGGR